MATVHGKAGEWARVKGTVMGLWPMFLGVFVAGFALAAFIFARAGVGAALLVVALVWIGANLSRGLRRVESFYKGARGEERVAGILRDLPASYHVFNDFVAGRAHVDHVVVGPAGVFAVETKDWRGEVTVEEGHVLLNGQLPDRAPLAQVLREAKDVKNALAAAGWSGDVTPVLAFASDTFKAHVAEVQGAVVINSSELNGCFVNARVTMMPAERERLVSLMENMQ